MMADSSKKWCVEAVQQIAPEDQNCTMTILESSVVQRTAAKEIHDPNDNCHRILQAATSF